MTEAPEAMMPANEFAQQIGTDVDTVIRGIKDGVYRGKQIDNEWYVITSSQRIPNGNQVAIENGVTIVDIKMPFFSMVSFMVKWALASIPAFFILVLIFVVILSILVDGFGIDINIP